MRAAEELARKVGPTQACNALSLSRATYYRHGCDTKPTDVTRPRSPRRIPDHEREKFLAIANSERFVDRPPAAIYASLLGDGEYVCSERSMYRILAENDQVRERRLLRSHSHYQKPELVATRPNQVWSWDITKLKGPRAWSYFHLYVIIDIYSRYVVAWLLAHRESADLAQRMIEEASQKQGVDPDQLTLHADRGPSMRSLTVGQLLEKLGVTKSHNRPYHSQDNPFSESQFKTLKYSPGFPDRFHGGYDEALEFCRRYFPWYNQEHRHSGIALLTPEDVHYGHADAILERRQQTLLEAYHRTPERFVNGPPSAGQLPKAVWINQPTEEVENREEFALVAH